MTSNIIGPISLGYIPFHSVIHGLTTVIPLSDCLVGCMSNRLFSKIETDISCDLPINRYLRLKSNAESELARPGPLKFYFIANLKIFKLLL